LSSLILIRSTSRGDDVLGFLGAEGGFQVLGVSGIVDGTGLIVRAAVDIFIEQAVYGPFVNSAAFSGLS
jgi:hypothetical protein